MKKSKPQVSLISESEEETKKAAGRLARRLKPGDIVLLQGDLGSGKTTFVKGLAKALGATSRQVNSPTFVLMNRYRGKFPIYHFDLYRLERPQEIDSLDFDDYFYGQGISVIEWPQRLGAHKPQSYYLVGFQHQGENRRKITLSFPSPIKAFRGKLQRESRI